MSLGTRWVVGVGSLALTLGAVLMGGSMMLRRDAGRAVREGSYLGVSRTRALDQIEAGDDESRDRVSEWLEDANDDDERATLTALLDCLASHDAEGPAPGLDCSAEVDSARDHYATKLADTWSAAETDESRAEWVSMLGATAFALGALLPLGWLARVPRPAKTAEPTLERATPPPNLDAAKDRVTPEVESLLRQRLEDLYATRKRVWESERFAAYGELAAGLSHGLKTPLASIRAATQVAIKRIGRDHAASDTLRDVIDEVDGLVEQVKRFLSATGTGAPVPARVAPGQIVEAIETAYTAQARIHGVTLAATTEAGLDQILVDAALIEMALRNLIENALAAAPKGSTVSISATTSPAPARAGLDNEKASGDAWIALAVSDQGGGIPSEVLDAQKVVSKKPEGSGLGLAIARRIAERHGGALVLETSAETGTTVRLLLPAEAAVLA